MQGLVGATVTVIGIHYAPETTGNAPYTTALATAIAADGAEVDVITGVPHYPSWKVDDPKYRHGLRWREVLGGIPLIRVRHTVPATPKLLGRAALEASFLLQSVVAASRKRSDAFIAVTPGLSALAASLICRRGRAVGVLVQDITGAAAVQSGTSGDTWGSLISRLEYWLLRKADRVGVIAPRFGSILVANGVPAERIVSLPNFTHVTAVAVDPPEARSRLGWPQRFSVVHTGNMGMKQGLESVVEAAAVAERVGLDIQFVLVGDGNQRAHLQELAAGCRNISFVDPLDADDYPYALAAADVLLLNERAGVREMSLPSKLTSYTVAGRPIVAAVEGDGITAEVLARHGSALACAPGDPRALIDAVQTVRGRPELATDLVGAAAALHAEQYGQDGAYQRYVRFALTLLQDGDRARSGGHPDGGAPSPAGPAVPGEPVAAASTPRDRR